MSGFVCNPVSQALGGKLARGIAWHPQRLGNRPTKQRVAKR